MKSWFKASRESHGTLGLSALLILSVLSATADFKPTGHDELDAIRESIASDKTNSENYKLRLFMLKQWICALQQMGAECDAFLEVSEVYKRNAPWNLIHLGGIPKPLTPKQQAEMFPAIDRGYEILDAIYDECNQLTADPTVVLDPVPAPAPGRKPGVVYEDWPLYQKMPQHKGFTETDIKLAGKEAWKFPIGFAAYAQPVVEDGIVYAISPGMRTMMYSLDLETGKEIWTTKQLADIVQDQLYWTPAAGSTPRILKDRIIVRDIGSRGNESDTRYALVIDKKTGEISDRVEAGHVDYRTGYAPIVANERFIVFPHGPHDIHENPPVSGPLHRMICRDIQTGRTIWDRFTGASLCEPVMEGNSVVSGTMNGNVFCFNLLPPGADERAGSVRWQFQADGGVNNTPLIHGGKVIFGANDGTVTCLSEEDGRLLWSFKTDPERRAMMNFASPVAANGKIYIGSADKTLYCLNEADGSLAWTFEMPDWIRASAVVDGSAVYVSSFDGTLTCLEDKGIRAEAVWSKKSGTHQVLADLTFSENKILVSTTDLFLWCYNSDGELLWKKSLIESAYDGEYRILLEQVAGGSYFQSKVTAADGKVFFGTPSRFTHGVDSETGEELWRFELGAAISVAPSFSNGKIYVGQQGGEEYFYCVDATNGQKIWQAAIGWVWGSCNIAEGKVLVPCIDGYATCLDENTGAIVWRHRTNSSLCTEPTIDNGTVTFGGWDRFIYQFDLHTGEIKWSKLFEHGSDSGAMIAHEGKLYFPSPGSEFRCLDATTGEQEWNFYVEASIFNVTPAFKDNHVFASAMIGRMLGSTPVYCQVYRINLETQEILWTHPGGGHTAPVVVGDRVHVGSLTSPYLYSLDEKGNGDGTTDCFWKFRMENRMEEACAAFYGDKLYILNSGGWVYAVE